MTLVAIVIASLLAAAIGSLVVSHLNRAYTDRDAAKAMNYAEAALNAQVQRISANLGGTQVKLDSASSNLATATYGVDPVNDPAGTWYPIGTKTPTSGYLPGVDAARGDYVRAWVWPSPLKIYNPDPTNIQYIFGSARINGVTRTVRAKSGSQGIFDTYALFGVSNMTLGSNITINGALGTDGTLSSSNGIIQGATSAVLAGPAASNVVGGGSKAITSPTLTTQPTAEPFPTIYDLANDVATGAKQFTGASVPPYAGTITTNNGIRNFTSSNDNLSATMTDNTGVGTSGSPADGSVPSGSTLKLPGKKWGANYYMTGISVSGSLNVDLTDGPVNLWIDSTATYGDSIT
jgi:type II secretory pathway pseudopilin PulG